ncbi:MAG TPA: hypothetical protein VIL63_02410, partial [Terriglobales bacterium]
VVVGAFLDLVDFVDRKARAFSDFSGVSLWDLAQLCHRLAGEDFDLEPNPKFSLLGPKLAHLRAGITIDHRARLRSRTHPERAKKEASLKRTAA